MFVILPMCIYNEQNWLYLKFYKREDILVHYKMNMFVKVGSSTAIIIYYYLSHSVIIYIIPGIFLVK